MKLRRDGRLFVHCTIMLHGEVNVFFFALSHVLQHKHVPLGVGHPLVWVSGEI